MRPIVLDIENRITSLASRKIEDNVLGDSPEPTKERPFTRMYRAEILPRPPSVAVAIAGPELG